MNKGGTHEASEDSFIELQTGCLCCKVRTDLAQTLQDLLHRRDERLSAADPAIYCGKGLDHVLAEWGEAPTQEQIALQMRARDRRLAALKAHKALNR